MLESGRVAKTSFFFARGTEPIIRFKFRTFSLMDCSDEIMMWYALSFCRISPLSLPRLSLKKSRFICILYSALKFSAASTKGCCQ